MIADTSSSPEAGGGKLQLKRSESAGPLQAAGGKGISAGLHMGGSGFSLALPGGPALAGTSDPRGSATRAAYGGLGALNLKAASSAFHPGSAYGGLGPLSLKAAPGGGSAGGATGGPTGDMIGAALGGGGAGFDRAVQDAAPVRPQEVAGSGFQGGGHEIPYRAELEQSFGADFSSVRAHTDEHAQTASKSLGAHAYAQGDQIAFASANPDKALVAHELTHVLQQSASPALKSAEGGIETGGESEADAVQDAVAAGRPAASALQGVRANGKSLALSADPKYAMGMTFSREGFEKSYEYKLGGKAMSWPTPVPGLNVIVDPAVKVFGKGGAKYGGKNKGELSLSVGVGGEIGLGVSGGVANVAEFYLTGTPGLTGAGAYARNGNAWSLDTSLEATCAGKIGVKLGGGVVDKGFELFNAKLFKLTGLYWDQNGFDSGKLGFEWGEDIKPIFDALAYIASKAKEYGGKVVKAVTDTVDGIFSGISQVYEWLP